MADSLDIVERLEHAVILVHQGVKHKLHSDCMVRNRQVFDNLVLTDGCVNQPAGLESDLLNYALGHKVIDIIAPHVKQLVLDRGTSAIDNQNDHYPKK